MKKLIISTVAALCGAIAAVAQGPQVATSCGTLEGIDQSGLKIFLGVPFAQPPVGELRWQAPQPVEPWQGVREAKDFGPDPMQQPIFGDMNFSAKEMSEDCLYLNIWTPTKAYDEKLPVLIYFNGGGLMAGSGSEPRYAGWSMARMGIISITANYREGIFGFFAHPELSEEAPYGGSGNYGFLDQMMAIKWVKENIAAFGGDPERITIVGESAGSMSVSALMASPLCKGLFAQAIGSSGSVLRTPAIPTLAQAEATGTAKMKEMGCNSLAELRALPADVLMERAAISDLPRYNIDNYFFTEQPQETYAAGRQARVPLFVGGTSAEADASFILWGGEMTYATLLRNVSVTFGDRAAQILAAYGITDGEPVIEDNVGQLAADMFIGFSTWKWGHQHKLTSGMPVYRYQYCHPRPEMVDNNKVAMLAGGVRDKQEGEETPKRQRGAVHSADIEYAMGTLPTNRVFNWQPEDYVVSEIFQNYYVNFVKTGNPNGLGLTEWPATNGQEVPPVLLIGTDTHVEVNKALEERYLKFDSLFK